MNRDELIEYHDELCKAARDLMKMKNHDYAGENAANPWMNFQRSEIMGVCKTEQAFMVRILDKVSRLITFVDAGQLAVKSESVHDSIIDIINYMVLFAAFNSDKAKSDRPVQGQAGFLTEEDLD
jgi:hypothetical protein